jgi:hypothetical protein
MTTGLQRARNAIICKALLIKGLKGLAPLYANVVEASEELEDGVEDASHGVLVPIYRFLESLDKVVDIIEDRTEKEFPDADISPSDSPDLKEAARRTAKSLREISEWAQHLAESIKKFDPEVASTIEDVRDNALGVAMNLEDLMLPENTDDSRDQMLMLEYKKLSGILLD